MKDVAPISALACHDPRISNCREDRRMTKNLVLMTIELARRRGLAAELIDWDEVADNADRWDWPADKEELLEM